MRNYYRFNLPFPFSLVLLCMVCCCSPNTSTEEESSLPSLSPSTLVSELHSSYSFTENRGQLGKDHTALYYLQGEGSHCYLRQDGISYIWTQRVAAGSKESTFKSQQVNLTWEGANPNVKIKGYDPLSDVYHFYSERVPEGLHDVPHFQEVLYEDLYPHIDLKLYFDKGKVKYDLIVHPGGKVADIQFSYQGQDSLYLDSRGQLQLRKEQGQLQEGKPYSYQNIGNTLHEVASGFVVENDRVRFEVASYDSSYPLIIDPEVVWATYFGEVLTVKSNEYPDEEYIMDICTDSQGNIYMTGSAYGDWIAPHREVLILKFSPDGDLIWKMYYGGGSGDYGFSIRTDSHGNIYVGGTSESRYGIALDGYDESINESEEDGSSDAFLVKFNPEGTRLWGTYYGGDEDEEGRQIAVDNSDDVYLVGYTRSQESIASASANDAELGSEYLYDAFLVKFTPNGYRQWGTYYGGEGNDYGSGICVSPTGVVYITGTTTSSGLGYNGWDNEYNGGGDAFLAMYDESGNLYWSTYVGGSGEEQGHSLASNGFSVYLVGITGSPEGITRNGYDEVLDGENDAFLVKFGFLGNPIWSTYFGGEGTEGCCYPTDYDNRDIDVALSPNGKVYIAGETFSDEGIATSGSINPSRRGSSDVYLAEFTSDGELEWSTYYGGEGMDEISGLAIDPASRILITGGTESLSNISKNGYQNSHSGGAEIFLAKINPNGDTSEMPDGFQEEPNDPGEDSPKMNLTLSPNPSSGKVTVSYHGKEKGPFQILVMDKEGKTLYQSKELMAPVEEKLDLSKLKTGLYTVVLDAGKFRLSEELILLK